MRTRSIRMSNLKWLVGVGFLLLLLFASASQADARGGRWSGIDPEIRVNGQQVNVRVEWPTRYNCTVEETKVRFLVPKDSDHALIAESNDLLQCNDGGFTRLETESRIDEKFDHNMVSVRAKVKASESFPVRVFVYLNGELAAKCGGYSNGEIRCGRISLDETQGWTSSDSAFETGSDYTHESFYVTD